MSALSRADFLLGKLAREGSKLPNPHLLMRPFITREAVLSSKIEGTQATIGEILAASAGISVKRNPEDLQEVQNYIEALDYGIKRLDDLPWIRFPIISSVGRGGIRTPVTRKGDSVFKTDAFGRSATLDFDTYKS